MATRPAVTLPTSRHPHHGELCSKQLQAKAQPWRGRGKKTNKEEKNRVTSLLGKEVQISAQVRDLSGCTGFLLEHLSWGLAGRP